MPSSAPLSPAASFLHDFKSSVVVFLVAIPLCLGIALASGAPLFAGLLSGIIGGIVIGTLSGSHTSVSGPAAGLTAVVSAQITELGGFETFLLAVFLAGAIQIGMGLLQAGGLAKFVPSSVINGLLSAIGVILILKQIPHLLGHDTDPDGEMSFTQPDKENTFSELLTLFQGEIHAGAVVIGILSVVILMLWPRIVWLQRRPIPAPLVVVILGVLINLYFTRLGAPWSIESSHLVQVPVVDEQAGFLSLLVFPELSSWADPALYLAAVTIALVASLETLLNLEAVDRLDPQQRTSPANRELLAQGAGNMLAGLIGGLPMTSVIVRGSVNINSGAKTKLSAILHGVLILASVALLPTYLNSIPLSSLAAILIVTGMRLASPSIFSEMWQGGRDQFLPFLITLLAIVFSDLLIGVLVGLAVSTAFILRSNLRSQIPMISEKHLGTDVLRIVMPNQVTFLNRAAILHALRQAPSGSHLLLDGSATDYIDPDILGIFKKFRQTTAAAHQVQVSFVGFQDRYGLKDNTRYIEHSTLELQTLLTPEDVLEILREGNLRFHAGKRLARNIQQQVSETSHGQYPFACVLSCIDSRAPVETVFDLGLGDIFSIRVAGNITSGEVLGSIEYACSVAGAKLVLVLGHTKCGAVTAATNAQLVSQPAPMPAGEHLHYILDEIRHSIPAPAATQPVDAAYIEAVAVRNVRYSVQQILEQSPAIHKLVNSGRVAVVGAMYDVSSGLVEFYTQEAAGLDSQFAERFARQQPPV